MSDSEKPKVDVTDQEEKYEDSDEEWSDEELAMREIVLGLPSLRLSNEVFGTSSVVEADEGETEARLNEQAVVAAELVLAAAVEAGMKGKSEDGGSSGKKKIVRRRKIGINEEAGGSGTGEGIKPKKRSSELTNPPPGPPTCNVCGKGFGSWKAVFGHMRTHTDRNYKGFLPPPRFSAAAEGYPMMGQTSSFVLVPAGEGGSGFGGASGSEGGSGLGIDLNEEPMDEVTETTETTTIVKFDLNKSPPKDEEETDKSQ